MNFRIIVHIFILSQRLSTLFFSKLDKIWSYNFGSRRTLETILKNTEWQSKNWGLGASFQFKILSLLGDKLTNVSISAPTVL